MRRLWPPHLFRVTADRSELIARPAERIRCSPRVNPPRWSCLSFGLVRSRRHRWTCPLQAASLTGFGRSRTVLWMPSPPGSAPGTPSSRSGLLPVRCPRSLQSRRVGQLPSPHTDASCRPVTARPAAVEEPRGASQRINRLARLALLVGREGREGREGRCAGRSVRPEGPPTRLRQPPAASTEG